MNHQNRRRFCIALSALAMAAAAAPLAAASDDYPSRPVSILVPYPPGGASDVTARLLADKMSQSMGVPVVVENRPGANGVIATDAVAKARPDGYTILMANVGPNAISQSVYPNLPYDTVKDFSAISQTTLVPIVLVAGPAMDAENIDELIAKAKAQPGHYTFASAGNGASNHLAGELFKSMAGVDMLHVPYRGDTPALTDVMAGQVSMMFTTVVAAMPHITSGKLRLMAVATNRKIPALGDAPTLDQAGVIGYDAASWGGLVAPAGTPSAILERLYQEQAKALAHPDVSNKLADLGAEIVGSSPSEFQKYIEAETAKWGDVARSNNIQIE